MNWQQYYISTFNSKNGILGFITRDIVGELGRIVMFFLDSVKWFFRKPFRFHDLITHMEFVGNKSIFIIVLTGLFTGLVFSFQGYLGLSIVNAETLIGPMVGVGIYRELGPVLTGLIIAARAGGAMTARLGTMRVTEQIDALEVMGVNPKQYLIAPRILAAIIATPLLNSIFCFVAMLGAYILVVKILRLDFGIFIDKIVFYLDPRDVNEGLIKSSVFGAFFATICTYVGFNTRGGAKGVGDSTNKAVVVSMVSIIVVDYFITKLIRYFVKGSFW